MLEALSHGSDIASHNAFQFLNAPAGVYVNPALSWQSLFSALQSYLDALDSTGGSFTSRLAAPSMREISPSELMLIEAFLSLLATIMAQSEVARNVLADAPQFNAVNRLLSLLACAVPASLKGRVFEVLSGLAATPTIGWQIWHMLEQSQLLVPGRTVGLKYELEQVESQNETYPEMRGFLGLLRQLVRILPSEMFNTPGSLAIFLLFVQDDIFGKLRSSRLPSERRKVGDCKSMHGMHCFCAGVV